jgi:hypothetical protein
LTEPSAFGPYRFSLTEEEARVATARLALRYGLFRRFERDYVAPLALFILLLALVAILAFTGLIARRLAEIALLAGAILFLASRFVAHLRLRGARLLAKKVIERIAADGETSLTVDEGGLAFTRHAGSEQQIAGLPDLTEIENAGGLFYIWISHHDTAPLVVPTRIFADDAEAERFLARLRGRTSRNQWPQGVGGNDEPSAHSLHGGLD